MFANFLIDVANCCKLVAKIWHRFRTDRTMSGCFVKLAPLSTLQIVANWLQKYDTDFEPIGRFRGAA
ncbi:Uncharacterized protein FWK35_00003478 [Aphis craccivora]|uniref:Uncharacterized protein n=1 Tax=Aphis craccivora TaxID=307492 RepID=A0A6G0Z7Z6_APHCR|nr:Uncharacterized protein FWK35_00003478 [Aphis craccivora]